MPEFGCPDKKCLRRMKAAAKKEKQNKSKIKVFQNYVRLFYEEVAAAARPSLARQPSVLRLGASFAHAGLQLPSLHSLPWKGCLTFIRRSRVPHNACTSFPYTCHSLTIGNYLHNNTLRDLPPHEHKFC